MNAYGWAVLRYERSPLPGGKTGEGNGATTPSWTQLAVNFLHLRTSSSCSMLQFNEGFHPPVPGTWLRAINECCEWLSESVVFFFFLFRITLRRGISFPTLQKECPRWWVSLLRPRSRLRWQLHPEPRCRAEAGLFGEECGPLSEGDRASGWGQGSGRVPPSEGPTGTRLGAARERGWVGRSSGCGPAGN